MAESLAIDGGTPLRAEPFPPWPYFDEETIQEAMEPLRQGKPNYWTGPYGMEFQEKFASLCGGKHGIAVNWGTSALHVACGALELGPDDEPTTRRWGWPRAHSAWSRRAARTRAVSSTRATGLRR